VKEHKEMIMSPTSENIASANSTGAPYVAANFAPLKSEVTSFDLEVIGHIPEELTGRLLRIGPNPIDDLDQVRLARHHWFAGSGMACGCTGARRNGSAVASFSTGTPPGS
jgi:carotenoid cleavage dioxygenase-like enzyme